MGQSILAREVSDIMDGMDDNKPAAGCKAHTFTVAGVKKSLRLHEEAAKRDKLHMVLTFLVFASVWLKGDALEKLVAIVLKLI